MRICEEIEQIYAHYFIHKKLNNLSFLTKTFLSNIMICQRLRVLSMGNNRLTEVPSTLGELKVLQALVLCDNMLESLPSSIANLTNLKTLSLHKNRLRTLPTEIITLKCLTEVGYK